MFFFLQTKQTQLEKEGNPQNVVSANNSVSWIYRTWDALHGVMISLFQWTELPKYINPQTFTWSSPVMSAADFTCPGDGVSL